MPCDMFANSRLGQRMQTSAKLHLDDFAMHPCLQTTMQDCQPEMFIECCAMQLAIMLEPALTSPSPAPVRLLSSVMQRLVRYG